MLFICRLKVVLRDPLPLEFPALILFLRLGGRQHGGQREGASCPDLEQLQMMLYMECHFIIMGIKFRN